MSERQKLMAGEPDLERWEQLGRLLRRRRYDMDPTYGRAGGLQKFADDRGINFRMAWDIEHARRTNYEDYTLADISRAYRLDRWAVEDFILHGKPLAEEDGNPYASDPDLAKVWDASRGLKSDERHGLVELMREARGEGRGGNGDRRRRA